MSITGLHVFDQAVDEANEWLHELMDELDWSDRHRAYLALRGALHEIRDRLPWKEAANIGSALPMVIRGIFFEDWQPSNSPTQDGPLDDVARSVREILRSKGIKGLP